MTNTPGYRFCDQIRVHDDHTTVSVMECKCNKREVSYNSNDPEVSFSISKDGYATLVYRNVAYISNHILLPEGDDMSKVIATQQTKGSTFAESIQANSPGESALRYLKSRISEEAFNAFVSQYGDKVRKSGSFSQALQTINAVCVERFGLTGNITERELKAFLY